MQVILHIKGWGPDELMEVQRAVRDATNDKYIIVLYGATGPSIRKTIRVEGNEVTKNIFAAYSLHKTIKQTVPDVQKVIFVVR